MFVLLPEVVRYFVELAIATVVTFLSSSSITTLFSPMFRRMPIIVVAFD